MLDSPRKQKPKNDITHGACNILLVMFFFLEPTRKVFGSWFLRFLVSTTSPGKHPLLKTGKEAFFSFFENQKCRQTSYKKPKNNFEFCHISGNTTVLHFSQNKKKTLPIRDISASLIFK